VRVGIGYDIHRLAAGRRLVLGGVAIEHPKGLVGHSDGDVLLHALGGLIRERGLGVGSLDATVIAEMPRLAPHVQAMREAIAGAIGVGVDRVSVKATTNDGLGVIGAEEAIAALAIAHLE